VVVLGRDELRLTPGGQHVGFHPGPEVGNFQGGELAYEGQTTSVDVLAVGRRRSFSPLPLKTYPPRLAIYQMPLYPNRSTSTILSTCSISTSLYIINRFTADPLPRRE